jgi:sterol desaturase/sphingolipid hydroxylase (fatty acid hydroxylase superfamily)
VPDFSVVSEVAGAFLSALGARVVLVFLSPATYSVASLAVAGCIAVLFLGTRRKDPRKPLRLKVLWRALFPRRITRSISGRADIWFTIINLFIVGSLLGWAVMSSVVVSHFVGGGLNGAFGPRVMLLPDVAAAAIVTLALFLAFEFGYWIDHWLSHNVPFLWEFHKVHHSAEVLTPLTDFRVHPVDTVIFNNILGLSMGATGGVVTFLLGREVEPVTLSGINVLTLVFAYGLMHLQHSHVWIAFTGVWGRLLLSPAHHQLHHSTDPAHFNKNLGSFIAIWDVLFGTLCMPSKKRQKLVFGVDPVAQTRHTMREGFIAPFARAFATLKVPKALQDFIDDSAREDAAAPQQAAPAAPQLVPVKAAD